MVDMDAQVSVRRQCELLQLNRSGLYYEPVQDSAESLALMRRIDELHLEFPFYGSRKLTIELRGEGHAVNRKRVQRLMAVIGHRVSGAEAEYKPGSARTSGGTRTCSEMSSSPLLLKTLERSCSPRSVTV